MENRIINKIRNVKRKIRKLYQKELNSIDFKIDGIVDSSSLNNLQILSNIDEDLTDIIYNILEIKNSEK